MPHSLYAFDYNAKRVLSKADLSPLLFEQGLQLGLVLAGFARECGL